MPVQIIDKKAGSRLLVHPLQHELQFLIVEMMTKQGREDDIWLLVAKINRLIVCGKELCTGKRQTPAGDAYTRGVVVYANQLYRNIFFLTPVVNGQQVISAPTTNFAYSNGFSVLQQLPETTDSNTMTAQPGINKIQFFHVLPYIGKWNALSIQ